MSVRSQFCATLDNVQEKEMQEFIDAVTSKNYRKAANILESLGAMTELGLDLCDIGSKRRDR